MHQSPHGEGACSGVFLKTDTHNKSGICDWGGRRGGGSLHCPGRDKDIWMAWDALTLLSSYENL